MAPAPASILVPPPTDEREPDDQLTLFARRGQLALPGSAAQLGLDGVAYAPASPEPRSGEPSLGNATPPFDEISPQGGPAGEGETQDRADRRADVVDPATYAERLRASLSSARPRDPVLFAETWEAADRQLTMWPQLDARLPLVPERQAKCQRTRYRAASDVEAIRSPSNRWRLCGVVSCDRWTCPCCGPRKARAASALLGVCFERHRERHPDGGNADADRTASPLRLHRPGQRVVVRRMQTLLAIEGVGAIR